MSHHVLELCDCLDDLSWRRLFSRNDVEPQFSRHGEDTSTLCITWNSSEVTLHAIYVLADPLLREARTQSTLYTDVIEPPYRMQPQPLDHGRTVHQWWRGRDRNTLRWPAGEHLPEAVRSAVVRLYLAGHFDQWPEVTTDAHRITIQFSVTRDWRTRTMEDRLCDALEVFSTPTCPIQVAFVELGKPGLFPWVKRPLTSEGVT